MAGPEAYSLGPYWACWQSSSLVTWEASDITGHVSWSWWGSKSDQYSMKDRQRKIIGVVEGWTSTGNNCVIVDWNRKTSNIVNGQAQGVASVMVYVCGLRIKEVILFSWEKKDHINLTRISAWRRNWQAAVTVWSSRVEFVAIILIIGADRLGLHAEKSVTIHDCLPW